MTALKEERCEREPPVDDDDFGGLACPPLDDLEAVFILETITCDPSNLFDDIKLEDDDFRGLPCPPLDDLEAIGMMKRSWRLGFESSTKAINIDIKNLPLPPNQGTFLTSSRKCRAF
ncbi:hypothetical protein L3X38_027277 [Prunus dulcis]|uniref:Uncharacterized protein n=1 Tax=Prunus dulcis TaxID=3755 RepID=A0AAD4VNI8_PRUDU|nr:hypothetical protein L3X38_027277 [Prunus dulcis]